MQNTLFSDYYLERLFTEDVAFRNAAQGLDRLRGELLSIFEHIDDWAPDASEAELEDRLVRPALRALGFEYLVQTPLRTRGIQTPDYLLYPSSDDRRRAESDRESAARFANGLAEAKRWDVPLDRRLAGGGFDRANPSFQVDSYLRDSDLEWAVLTNGRLWRLYHRSTSYRLDAFLEINLLDALRGETELQTFAALFSAAAFPRTDSPLLPRALHESTEFATALGASLQSNVYGYLSRRNWWCASCPEPLTLWSL